MKLPAEPQRGECSECKRELYVRSDGLMIAHRAKRSMYESTFTSSWCPGSHRQPKTKRKVKDAEANGPDGP